MNIEQWPLDKLILYVRNPRDNRAAVSAVKASIKEFGFRQPIVVDRDGVIVVGHTRYQAALELGLASVPVHVATELTLTQVKAYRIMDNRSHDKSDWDIELLKLEIDELEELSVNLELTGFDEESLKDLLNSWDPDFSKIDKIDENLDGIKSKIIGIVENDEVKQELIRVITGYCEKNSIKIEIK